VYLCLVFLVTHQDSQSRFIPQVSLITAWLLLVTSYTVVRGGSRAELAYAFLSAVPIVARDGGLRAPLTVTARPWLIFDMGGDAGWFPSSRVQSLFVGVTVIPIVFGRDAAP